MPSCIRFGNGHTLAWWCPFYFWLAGSAGSLIANDEPVEVLTIKPIVKQSIDNGGKCPDRKQGGNPRVVQGHLVFDGSDDGNRQVDPQIAVGKNHVLHATNHGIIVYDKHGKPLQGVGNDCFNGGIDPKVFYDIHNHYYAFDLWNPWDQEKLKPVNVAVSQSDDPTGGWYIYPVPAPKGVDGGGIGYSRKWIGYSFPGGDNRTFVMSASDARVGNDVEVFFFKGNLGQPVFTQDPVDEIYFFAIVRRNFVLNKVTADHNGRPVATEVFSVPHQLKYIDYPPASPQPGTNKPTASGDRNPKNVVLQGNHIWFSQAVNVEGRSAVQWHQLDLTGKRIQSGLISDPHSSFIETTMAVNQRMDVLVGFQETNENMFISPRMAYRLAEDPPGQLRPTIALGEGKAATEGGAWGDYSGSMIDGENLLDLWTVQSIADQTGKGDTVIARIRLSK